MTPNREESVRLRKLGKTSCEIAAALGISRERVCHFLREVGLAEDARKPATVKKGPDIKRLANDGLSQDKIRTTLRTSFSTIYSVLGPGGRKRASERAFQRACEKHVGKQILGSRLVVESIERWCSKNKQRYCLCRCDCGNTKRMQLRNVIRGFSRSCGCLQKEWLRSGNAHRGAG